MPAQGKGAKPVRDAKAAPGAPNTMIGDDK